MKTILTLIFSMNALALFGQPNISQQLRYGENKEYLLEYSKRNCRIVIKLLRHDSLVGQANDFCNKKLFEDIEIIEVKHRLSRQKLTSYLIYELEIDGLDDGILKMIVFFDNLKVVLKGNYAKQSSSKIKSKVAITSNQGHVSKTELEYYSDYLHKMSERKSREAIKFIEG